MVLMMLKIRHVLTPIFLNFFIFLIFFKLFMSHVTSILCHVSRQYCVTCQVNKVTHVKSLSESQFSPYIFVILIIFESIFFLIFNFIISKLTPNLTFV